MNTNIVQLIPKLVTPKLFTSISKEIPRFCLKVILINLHTHTHTHTHTHLNEQNCCVFWHGTEELKMVSSPINGNRWNHLSVVWGAPKSSSTTVLHVSAQKRIERETKWFIRMRLLWGLQVGGWEMPHWELTGLHFYNQRESGERENNFFAFLE